VTEKVHRYVNKFDKEYWSERKARERGVTSDVILAEWKEKGDIANRKGTNFHKYAENMINNKFENIEVDERLISMFKDFYYTSSKSLIPVKSEIVIGDTDLQIAGMIDQLYWSNKLDGLVIFDWKTNKAIKKTSFRRQKMLHTFRHLDDCEFNTYSLQQNIYKYIIEKNSNLKIKALFLGWFNEKNPTYEIFKCLDLQDKMPVIFDKNEAKMVI